MKSSSKTSMGDSHLAGKKYWIISWLVEVITSQSNEIYHEWPKATSDKFITLTSDTSTTSDIIQYFLPAIWE